MIIKGNDLILFYRETISGETTNTPLSRSTSCSLEMTNEELEVTSKTSGDFKEFLKGKMEWSVSVDGLVDFDDVDGYEVLNSAMFSGEPIDVAIGVATKDSTTTKPTGLDTSIKYYTGKVKVMSLSLNTGGAGETASYSATLKGDGLLSYNS